MERTKEINICEVFVFIFVRGNFINRIDLGAIFMTCLLVLLRVVITNATDDIQESHNSDRSGRSWHHPSLFSNSGPQMLLPHQQQALPAAASTSQPSDTSTGNSQNQQDPTGSNRNFEDPHDKMAAPSDLDYMARQFGYLNVHRFDPNFMNYYERQAYPRFPSPQAAPRFGPGYRKDKYGHGYGYSCKQGDDCDEVRAANQLAARHPAPPQRPHHPMMTFNNHYPDLPPFPSLPSSDYSSLIPPSPSYQPHNPYAAGGLFGPARYNDPHSMSSMMPPPRYYHARYLHDQDENRVEHRQKAQQQSEESIVPPPQHVEGSPQ